MLRGGSLRSLLDAFRYLLAKKVERVALRYRAEKKKVRMRPPHPLPSLPLRREV